MALWVVGGLDTMAYILDQFHIIFIATRDVDSREKSIYLSKPQAKRGAWVGKIEERDCVHNACV